jgi:hypothetical protein
MEDKKQEGSTEAYTIVPKEVKLDLEKDFKNFAIDISSKIKDANRPSKMVSAYLKNLLDFYIPKLESENVDSFIQSLSVIANKKKKEELDKNKKEIKTKVDDFGDSSASKKVSKYNNDDDFM